MSSRSKTPSNYIISSESSEESSWTKYFEDFFNNHNNIDINHDDEKCSVSFSDFDDGSSSLISDAAAKKLADCAQDGMRLSFKKRKKIKTRLVDDDLEDTASSPINSPKIYKAKEKEEIDHLYQEKGNTLGERDEMKEVGFNEMDTSRDHTELNKKGLCLVPLSMVMNYLG
ncbi:vascular-related unknown protein 4-like isoform X2 [Cicer arietinum]|uniref:Uncharacterized protein n=1 Tax=Cicer arietinum TaxID=3827 RepID=A0A1S2XDD6_CICAR|nr:vascular-related unknown protein 4-like isoform X2 [Cicer arietinum]